ncbi:penicillin-binding protein activator [Puniceibacterium confluentis]|uniref:penicillin-binding protein activator n=1 Tax=Puniceibacterium confluentis TaxID=1958944 RepID=UPI0011B4043A|nr:penicillin-binding protein activator [Puniceibacterium confluentis]
MIAVLSTARKAIRRGAVLASCLWLAACDPSMMGPLGGSSGAGGPQIDTNAPVQVALLVPKSDPGAAPVARGLENAVRLAMADLQGVRIDLRVYDTAGSASVAASKAQQAVDEGAKIILGPLFGESANAAAVAVADEGVNVLSFSNNTSIAGGNLFVLGATFDNTADRLMSYATRQGKGDVVVLHTDSVAGQLGRNAITAAAARNGGSVVGSVPYKLNTDSLNSALNQVKGMVDSGAAKSMFITDNYDGGLSVVLQLGPERGINPASTQYIGLTRWDVRPDAFRLPGIEGSYFALPDVAMNNNFEARYANAYGSAPHALAGLGYDGIAAIGALVSQGRRDALTGRALTQASGFQGTGGVFRLLSDGTNQRGLAVATVRNSQVVILDPAPRSFGGAGF